MKGEMNVAINCAFCDRIRKKEAEIADLKSEQKLLLMLFDLTLAAVEKWGQENGLLSLRQQTDQGCPKGCDQIRVLLENIGKSGKNPTLDRFTAFLNGLQNGQ